MYATEVAMLSPTLQVYHMDSGPHATRPAALRPFMLPSLTPPRVCLLAHNTSQSTSWLISSWLVHQFYSAMEGSLTTRTSPSLKGVRQMWQWNCRRRRSSPRQCEQSRCPHGFSTRLCSLSIQMAHSLSRRRSWFSADTDHTQTHAYTLRIYWLVLSCTGDSPPSLGCSSSKFVLDSLASATPSAVRPLEQFWRVSRVCDVVRDRQSLNCYCVHRRRSGWNSEGDAWRAPKVSRCRMGGVWWGVSPLQPTRELPSGSENGFWRILKATERSFSYLYHIK